MSYHEAIHVEKTTEELSAMPNITIMSLQTQLERQMLLTNISYDFMSIIHTPCSSGITYENLIQTSTIEGHSPNGQFEQRQLFSCYFAPLLPALPIISPRNFSRIDGGAAMNRAAFLGFSQR